MTPCGSPASHLPISTVPPRLTNCSPSAARRPMRGCCTRAWETCTCRRSASRTRPAPIEPSWHGTRRTNMRQCCRIRPLKRIPRAVLRTWWSRVRLNTCAPTASRRRFGRIAKKAPHRRWWLNSRPISRTWLSITMRRHRNRSARGLYGRGGLVPESAVDVPERSGRQRDQLFAGGCAVRKPPVCRCSH